MRYIIFYVLMIFTRDALSVVTETTICLINNTQSSHRIEVADIDNYDWEGDNRPDKNFNNITIAPGATICRYEDLNTHAFGNKFTFVIDNNPTRMTWGRYDQQRWKWGAYTNPENPTAVHGYYAAKWSSSDRWFAGATCSVRYQCFGFELR